jgi:hypothetical protein
MLLVGVVFESQIDRECRYEGYSLERMNHNFTTLDCELERGEIDKVTHF